MFSAVRGMTKNVTTSKVKNNRKVAKAYFRLATFAYSQYKSIDTRLKSTEWQKQEELKRLNEEEYLRLEHQLRTTRNDVALRSSNKAKWEQQVRELARKVQPLHTQVTKDCEESTRLAFLRQLVSLNDSKLPKELKLWGFLCSESSFSNFRTMDKQLWGDDRQDARLQR